MRRVFVKQLQMRHYDIHHYFLLLKYRLLLLRQLFLGFEPLNEAPTSSPIALMETLLSWEELAVFDKAYTECPSLLLSPSYDVL